MVGRTQRGLRHRQQLGLVRARLSQVLDAQRVAAEQASQQNGVGCFHRRTKSLIDNYCQVADHA